MITQHCKNSDCNEEFPLDADHRFGGYCSSACARRNTKPPVFTGSRKPNTSQTIIAPHFNSKRGTDNKKVSGE